MPRIVADEVLALGRAGLIELCNSRAILDETEGVLIRKFRWSTPRAREAMQAIRAFTVLVHPREPVSLVRETLTVETLLGTLRP